MRSLLLGFLLGLPPACRLLYRLYLPATTAPAVFCGAFCHTFACGRYGHSTCAWFCLRCTSFWIPPGFVLRLRGLQVLPLCAHSSPLYHRTSPFFACRHSFSWITSFTVFAIFCRLEDLHCTLPPARYLPRRPSTLLHLRRDVEPPASADTACLVLACYIRGSLQVYAH